MYAARKDSMLPGGFFYAISQNETIAIIIKNKLIFKNNYTHFNIITLASC